MGSLGIQELIITIVYLIIFIGLPILIYHLGKKAGYKKGQMDVYIELEEDKKKKE